MRKISGIEGTRQRGDAWRPGGRRACFQEGAYIFEVQLLAEFGGMDVLKVFFPTEFAVPDLIADLFCDVEGRKAIVRRDLFLVGNLYGGFTLVIVPGLVLIGKGHHDDVHGRIGGKGVAYDPFQGPDLEKAVGAVCLVVYGSLHKEEVHTS
jgi:hypothetical protein